MIHTCTDDNELPVLPVKGNRNIADTLRRLTDKGYKLHTSWLGSFMAESKDGVFTFCCNGQELLAFAKAIAGAPETPTSHETDLVDTLVAA